MCQKIDLGAFLIFRKFLHENLISTISHALDRELTGCLFSYAISDIQGVNFPKMEDYINWQGPIKIEIIFFSKRKPNECSLSFTISDIQGGNFSKMEHYKNCQGPIMIEMFFSSEKAKWIFSLLRYIWHLRREFS